MPSVKHSMIGLSLIAFAGATAGCSELQLGRFAPPGFVKYEDIASKKPPNPAIEQRIIDRVDDSDVSFPVIARTPSDKDRPEKRPVEVLKQQSGELVAARDKMTSAIEADRAGVAAEREAGELLSLDREDLAEQLKNDKAAAQEERAKLPPLTNE